MKSHTMPLSDLRDRLAKRFPTAVIELDESANEHAGSFLNVRLNECLVIVEWRKKHGFGVSARPDIGYGEGVDEKYADEKTVLKRVSSLLLSQSKTRSPTVKLRELREALGLSQTELADRMETQQASISKIEMGRDLKMSTLNSLVEALGGKLSIAARFPDGTEQPLDVSALMGR